MCWPDCRAQVTVKRNQSALVPILQADIDAKRVAIYNQATRDKNPMSGTTGCRCSGLSVWR
jgi:hypothetical protein